MTRVPLTGGPLGIATSANSVTFATRQFANSVTRLNTSGTSWSDTIAVGNLPAFITFNPAGTKAYVANFFSHNIGVIDVASKTQIATIAVNADPVPVAVVPDGSTLFTTTDANRLYKIDLATNMVVDSLPLPATSHHLLAHPNDSLLYVATRDGGTVLEVVWRSMTVARTFVLGGRTQGMALSPDKKELYVANEVSNVLQIIDLTSGAVSAVALVGGGEGLAMSTDGRLLYVGLVFAGDVEVIDRRTRTVVNTIVTGGAPRGPREIAVDPNAPERVAVANQAGWVDIISGTGPASGPPSPFARVPLSGGPLGVAVSVGGVSYVTRDQAGSVARLNASATGWSDTIPVGTVPSYIAFHPNGTKAYVANQYSNNVGIIDVATNRQTTVVPVNGNPLPVAVAPDGSTLFTTTNANKLFKIDLATNKVIDSLALPATSHHLLAHPNDTLLYVATRDGGSVLEVQWQTMTVVRTFTLGGRPQGMALAPDKQELYVANELSDVLHVITLASGAATAIPLAGGGEGLSLNGSGTLLYVGLVFAGEVQVIDRKTRSLVATLITSGVPREIAADPGQSRLLVANEWGWVDIITEGGAATAAPAAARSVVDY